MLDLINTIAGVTGAIAGFISVVISLLTYLETKKSYSLSRIDEREQISPINENDWNELFEKDLMLFNKHFGRAIFVYILTTWMCAGIAYSITSSIIIAAVMGALVIFIYYLLSLLYLSYWKNRLRKIIVNANVKKAEEFAGIYASHAWDIVRKLLAEHGVNEKLSNQ